MGSVQGKFLVASPHLADGNFFRSVVLMIQHDDEGAFGVVINRPTSDNLIHVGGPVPGPPLAIHSDESCSENEVLPGVYVATDEETIERIVEGSSPYRVFSGYSGWAAGQLDHELEIGGWLIAPATHDQIFCMDVDSLWKSVTDSIGLDIIVPTMSRNRVPPDPNAN